LTVFAIPYLSSKGLLYHFLLFLYYYFSYNSTLGWDLLKNTGVIMKKTAIIVLLSTIIMPRSIICDSSLLSCLSFLKCKEYVFHREFKNGNDTLTIHRDKKELRFTFESKKAFPTLNTVKDSERHQRIINGTLEITASRKKGTLEVRDVRTNTKLCSLRQKQLFNNLSGKTNLKTQGGELEYVLLTTASTKNK
jgi:hypothetical protein